jgi:hypothetical protein
MKLFVSRPLFCSDVITNIPCLRELQYFLLEIDSTIVIAGHVTFRKMIFKFGYNGFKLTSGASINFEVKFLFDQI